MTKSNEPPPAPPRRPATGWALTLVAVVVVAAVYLVRYELLPFVIAGAVGFVFEPLIRWLQPRLWNRRGIPAGILYVLLLLALCGIGYVVVSSVAKDVSNMARQGPKMLHDMIAGVAGPKGISLFGKTYSADEIEKQLGVAASSVVSASGAAEIGGIGIGGILGVFLTLVLIPYFMVSGPRLVDGAIGMLPPERRPAIRRLLPHVVPALRRYLVGMVVVVIFTAVVGWLGFGLIFGLPHAILISIAVGLLEIIPALGPFASMVLVGLAAAQQHSFGEAAGLMAYAVFLRLAIDNGLGPFVFGRSVRLHPVAIMLAFICGASLFGILGLLLAVPFAASLNIVLEQFYARPRIEPRPEPALAVEPGEEPDP